MQLISIILYKVKTLKLGVFMNIYNNRSATVL